MSAKCTSAVVIGSGRVGSDLIKRLTDNGIDITVVEQDSSEMSNMKDPSYQMVQGNGADREVLEEAGIANADIVAAVTGDDQINLLACEMALNQYGVPVIVSRCNQPNYRDSFEELGIQIASPTNSCTKRIYEQINDTNEEKAEDEEENISDQNDPIQREIEVQSSSFESTEIDDLNIPSAVAVISVKRDGAYIQQPSGDTTIKEGDVLRVYGPVRSIDELEEAISQLYSGG